MSRASLQSSKTLQLGVMSLSSKLLSSVSSTLSISSQLPSLGSRVNFALADFSFAFPSSTRPYLVSKTSHATEPMAFSHRSFRVGHPTCPRSTSSLGTTEESEGADVIGTVSYGITAHEFLCPYGTASPWSDGPGASLTKPFTAVMKRTYL